MFVEYIGSHYVADFRCRWTKQSFDQKNHTTMKIFSLKMFALTLLALVMTRSMTQACNLSDVSLVSITGTGLGPFVITVRLCVGMGITGSTKGGDQSTNSVFFGFWDSDPSFSVLSFTPANMVGPMGCSMPGTNVGPDPYWGIQGEVSYTDPGYFGPNIPCTASPYGCVNFNPTCGNVQSFCRNFAFTVNHVPDSLRVFGVEGGGNPVGGCYPNSDMMLNLGDFPVIWGDLQALSVGAGIKIKWTTLTEVNSDYFSIERAIDGGEYQAIGRIPAVGNSNSQLAYEFLDRSPATGENRYRIVQVDKTGQSDDSEAITAAFTAPDALAWGESGPLPASDFINLTFYAPIPDVLHFELRDAAGKMAMEFDLNATLGHNALRLDMSKVNAGMYYLNMTGKNGKVMKKITKL
jgi:Secretion system C-terminal sorting domain